MGRARSSRAVVQTGVQTFEVHEFERPAVGPDDAVLRMELCGICGSDIEQYDGRFEERGWVRGPTIPGHEPLGIIDEIGERAAKRWGVAPGDRVAVEPLIPCGQLRGVQVRAFDALQRLGPGLQLRPARNRDRAVAAGRLLRVHVPASQQRHAPHVGRAAGRGRGAVQPARGRHPLGGHGVRSAARRHDRHPRRRPARPRGGDRGARRGSQGRSSSPTSRGPRASSTSPASSAPTRRSSPTRRTSSRGSRS